MNRLWAGLVLLLFFSVSCSAKPQGQRGTLASSPSGIVSPVNSPEPMPRGYSQEPFVVERYYTTMRFENDGTGERDLSVRIRVQSDAGALRLANLAFPYNSTNEQMDVRFVRVLKPDGTTVNASPDAIKDNTALEALDAPAYTNAREKSIAVPKLHSGDELEYEVSIRLVVPLAPGEFWLQHSFLDDAIVLDERFEVDAPLGSKITIKSPNFPYSTSSELAKGRIVYLWKRANLTSASHDSSKKSGHPEASPPDVQLTTFEKWEDVSRWYAKLQHGLAEPTPEIRAKTMDIIQGRANELDKIQALYEYVSKNIRYVSLPLDAAGYPSHSAGEVFTNRYGDSSDQQTLLTAMLQAAGIRACAALIPYSEKLNVSLPSPAQFDHVITAVPHGNAFIWMDSTAEVAPFRYLPAPLRKKSALIVAPDGAGKIADTPANPPFLSTQRVEIDSQMSDLGKLTAKVRYQMRGDTEFLLRLAFLRAPQSRWKELGQTILTFDGVHGNVISVKPSDPRDTRSPFEIEMEYTQWDFLDWSSKKDTLSMPLLVIGMPDSPDNNGEPVYLGSPLNVATRATLMLPTGFTAEPPAETTIDRDYAAFKSSYRFEGHTLTAERSLAFKDTYLPASRRSDYLAFRRAVEEDQNRRLVVENSAAGTFAIPLTASTGEIFEAGTAALASGSMQIAIPLFKRLVELEPGHKEAWNDLGLAYLRLGQFDEAVESFRRQIEVNPSDEHAHDYLGLALQQQHKDDEAASAFQKQIEMNPLDTIAHAALGELFLGEQEYAKAAPELGKATILSPENAELQVSLGQAYIYTGETAKALAAFEKAVEISPTPAIWNNVAFKMADHKIDLETAQRYAESAVSATAASLQSTDLSNVTNDQWNSVTNIASYWDTLGWVYFQKGDLAAAERYLRAAWLLDQNGEIGDHLAQVYQQQDQKDQAVHMYALALAAPHSVPDTRARLTLLLGGNAAIDDLVGEARPLLATLRTLPAGKILSENAQASFLVLLSADRKRPNVPLVDSVRFAGGSESLRPFADRLRSLDYGLIFPDASTVRIPRRGTLSCSAPSGACRFILLSPDDATRPN